MATIDSLPPETLCKIMGMLKPSFPLWNTLGSFPPGSYDDLRAAALVCSRWRDPAQRALFGSILIDDSKLIMGEKFLASPARPRFRTRSLEVNGSHTGWWLDVARATQGLEELTIRAWSLNSWESLSDPCFVGLKHLTILWPEALKDPAGSAPILTMRLESLALWLQGRVPPGSAPSAFIGALFAASSESLQTLHLKLEDSTSETSVHTSFNLVGANLRTLILESADDMLEGNFHFVSACTSLEHLVLKWDVEDPYNTRRDNPPTLPFPVQAILDALPSSPTLRHLSLDFYEPDDLDRIANLLKYPALERLANLDLPRMALRGGQDASLEPLRASELEDAVLQALLSMKETCDRRGIDCKGMGEYCMWEEEM